MYYRKWIQSWLLRNYQHHQHHLNHQLPPQVEILYMSISISIDVYLCLFMYVHICMWIYTLVCMIPAWPSVPPTMYKLYMLTYIYDPYIPYIYVNIYIWSIFTISCIFNTGKYICILTCIQTYIHIYIYIYIYIYCNIHIILRLPALPLPTAAHALPTRNA